MPGETEVRGQEKVLFNYTHNQLQEGSQQRVEKDVVDEGLHKLTCLESHIDILHINSLAELFDVLNLGLQVFHRYHVFCLEVCFWYHNLLLNLLLQRFTEPTA
jgi:hypothetical protein